MLDIQLSKSIKKRRSIYPKQFTGEKISKRHILELLENANTAPTHKMTQPWFFKIFSGKSKLDLVKELIKIQEINSDDVKEKLINKFALTSHVICICMRKSENKLIPEWEEVAATAMAVQNLWLSCVNSQNIGGYWSTPKGHEKLNEFLNLKTNERNLGLFYLGIYNQITTPKRTRKNIINDIFWYN